MTENKLKVRFIFKHNIQAHIQALKHRVCCTKNTRHDQIRDMTQIFAFLYFISLQQFYTVKIAILLIFHLLI